MIAAAARILVSDASHTGEARRLALTLASVAGLGESGAGKVAIAVTEAATNILKHAGSGEILLRVLPDDAEGGGVEMLALDKGPGIRDIAESLRDGYSTSGTAGNGLGAIIRQSNGFDLYSRPGGGSAIAAQFRARPAAAIPYEIAGFSVPKAGEQVSGDAWGAFLTPKGPVVMVVDGLGHGALAHSAAVLAVQCFEEVRAAEALVIVESVHAALRSTRGAAVAVARIDAHANTVAFAGIGNISGVIAAEGETRHMVSMNGIAGHEARTLREFSYPWRPNALMILHSDGVGTRWNLAAYPGLDRKRCGLIAGVVYRDWTRGHDDATVVVLRETSMD